MSTDKRSPNLFHNLVTKEDDYTQLLCNAILRFPDLGREVFAHIFSEMSSEIEINSSLRIFTQVSLAAHGRPDAVIRAKDLVALLEVKIKHKRGPTPNQGFDPKRLLGYPMYLQEEIAATGKWLLYLVPRQWEHIEDLHENLRTLNRDIPGIKAKITFWEDVVLLFERYNERAASALLGELITMFRDQFRPTVFSDTEKRMMGSIYSLDPFQAMRKLEYLVASIGKTQKCPTPDIAEDEYGIYFKQGKHYLLWFGLWIEAWKAYRGLPENRGKVVPKLWLGVYHQWTAEVLAVFRETVQADRLLELDEWTLTWIPDDVFLEGTDPIAQAWASIEPLLGKMRKAITKRR